VTTPSRHRYSVYGVRVTSDVPFEFPLARPAETPLADVEFVEWVDGDRLTPAPPSESIVDGWFQCRESTDESIYLRWADLYEFRVEKDGRQVACRQLAQGSWGVLQNFLFGQVLSFALVRQGLEQLHAAVLAVDDVAIGFLGDCRFGKSTLAAAFMQHGFRLLTDDVLTIEWRPSGPIAHPGSGRIKLQSDSALAWLPSSARGVPLHRQATKRSFPLGGDRLQRTGLPLTHLFVLPSPEEREASDGFDIRPLSRPAMVRELLKSSFNTQLLDRQRIRRQFGFAVQTASTINGCALRYPYGLHHLPTVRERVIAYVHQNVGHQMIAVR